MTALAEVRRGARRCARRTPSWRHSTASRPAASGSSSWAWASSAAASSTCPPTWTSSSCTRPRARRPGRGRSPTTSSSRGRESGPSRSCSDVTPDGQAFRVDMRLRPFGDSGPLVTSLRGARGLLHRPRPPVGALRVAQGARGQRPGRGVRGHPPPFVYRRYLDYGMLESLRELHARIFEAGDPPRARPTTSRSAPAASASASSRCSSSRWCAAGATRSCARPRRAPRSRAVGERGLIDARRASPPWAGRTSSCAASSTACSTTTTSRPRRCRASPPTGPPSPRRWDSTAGTRWPPSSTAIAPRVQEAFNALFERRTAGGASALLARLTDPQATPDAEGLAEDLARGGNRRRQARRRAIRRLHALAPLPRALGARSAPASSGCCPRRGGRAARGPQRRDGHPPPRPARGDRRARGVLLALLVEYPQVLAARRAPGRPQRAGPRGCSRAIRSSSTSSRARPRASRPPTGGGRARGARARMRRARRRRRAPDRPPAPLQAAPRAALHHRRPRGRAAGDGALRRALGARRLDPRRGAGLRRARGGSAATGSPRRPASASSATASSAARSWATAPTSTSSSSTTRRAAPTPRASRAWRSA